MRAGPIWALLAMPTFVLGNSDGQWIEHDRLLRLSIATTELNVDVNDLRFFLNNNDITPLVNRVGVDQFEYDARRIPMPSGEVTLTAYTNNWDAVWTQEYRVLTPRGFESETWGINTSFSVERGVDSEGNPTAPVDAPTTASTQISVQSAHRKNELALTSQLNTVGTNRQEQTLRFGEKGEAAPQLDLSDYLVTMTTGKLTTSLGHVNYASHPLLVPQLANRGLAIEYQMKPWLSWQLSQQNANAIAGWNNFFGLNESNHRILTTGLGVDVFPSQPGLLKINVSWLNGKQQSLNDFDAGQITDVEESDGWGATLASSLADNRVQFRAAWAESTFENPIDQALTFNNDVVTFSAETSTAWQWSLYSEIIKAEDGNNILAATVEQSETDALYRTVAATPLADQKTQRIDLNGAVSQSNWQYQHLDAEDNIANLASVLKTKTKTQSFTGQIPALQFANANGESKLFIPDTNISYQQVHQYSLNNPDAAVSDFNGGSHLPDQLTKNSDVSFNWQLGSASVGYTWSWSLLDNRQIGRENADFKNNQHSFNVQFSPFEKLSLNLAIGKSKNRDIEQNISLYNETFNVNSNWQLSDRWSLELSAGLNDDFTSAGVSGSDSTTVDSAIYYNGSWHWLSKDMTGQWFLRFNRSELSSFDQLFNIDDATEMWTLTSGVNVSW